MKERIVIEFEVKEGICHKQPAWYLKEKDTGRPLLFPNNDMIMFLDRESAEKVCELINNKAV